MPNFKTGYAEALDSLLPLFGSAGSGPTDGSSSPNYAAPFYFWRKQFTTSQAV